MVQCILHKSWHLNGKSVMKKAVMAMIMGATLLTLSSCGQAKNSDNAQTNVLSSTAESGDSTAEPGSRTGEVQKTQNDSIIGSAGSDLTELDHLTGEYELESSYRFLADSSNIENIEKYEYEGEYNSYDVNEPALEIKKNDDETYQIQIDLFRLWGFYDDAGKITEEGLEFATTGPGGNEMNGVIKLEADIAVVTIFGQEWLDFAGLSEYRFYKTSDVPNIDGFPANQQESSMQNAADTDSEAAADELLDAFIDGLADAVDSEDSASTFSVSDLNLDSEEWDTYSIGEKVDLDNDGENELIINGPYGGIYLDARDDKVYEFAAEEGTACILSYTYYNGAVWIMYSNRSSAGFEFYHMEKFEGADNLTAEMNFGEEFDPDNAEAGIKYTLNGAEISCDEYTELCSKIFAAEVNTN